MAAIILASGSPRRRELLEQMGIHDFTILVPEVEETAPKGLSPQKLVETLSAKKAAAAKALLKDDDAVIIAADTLVFLDGAPMGKPGSEEEAKKMLSALSGRTHHVCTGVTVLRGEQKESGAVTTAVRFASLSEETISAYVASGEPMDKAGAYGIQGLGGVLVEAIDGDYTNVVGLPIHFLGTLLTRVGIRVLGGLA